MLAILIYILQDDQKIKINVEIIMDLPLHLLDKN
jgi:hypothetical protein